jgi:hypothetical protein
MNMAQARNDTNKFIQRCITNAINTGHEKEKDMYEEPSLCDETSNEEVYSYDHTTSRTLTRDKITHVPSTNTKSSDQDGGSPNTYDISSNSMIDYQNSEEEVTADELLSYTSNLERYEHLSSNGSTQLKDYSHSSSDEDNISTDSR